MSRANAEAITPPDQTFPTLMLLILPVFPLIVCGRLAGFCVIQPFLFIISATETETAALRDSIIGRS